jgi:hypothetical protein
MNLQNLHYLQSNFIDKQWRLLYNNIRALLVGLVLLHPPPCNASEFSEAFSTTIRALDRTEMGSNVKGKVKKTIRQTGFDPIYGITFYGLIRQVFTLRTGNFRIRYEKNNYRVDYVIDF